MFDSKFDGKFPPPNGIVIVLYGSPPLNDNQNNPLTDDRLGIVAVVIPRQIERAGDWQRKQEFHHAPLRWVALARR
jgi:hypothetical protein